MWDGGARGLWRVSTPGEHETGLPANMQTATFIWGRLLIHNTRRLTLALNLICLAGIVPTPL